MSARPGAAAGANPPARPPARRPVRRVASPVPGARELNLPLVLFVDGNVGTKGSLVPIGDGKVVEAVGQEWRKEIEKTVMRLLQAAETPRGLVPTWRPIERPVACLVRFDLRRPPNTEFTEPVRHMDGDLDKMQRVVGDALQATRVIREDSLITRWAAGKAWASDGERIGMVLALVEPETVRVTVGGTPFRLGA